MDISAGEGRRGTGFLGILGSDGGRIVGLVAWRWLWFWFWEYAWRTEAGNMLMMVLLRLVLSAGVGMCKGEEPRVSCKVGWQLASMSEWKLPCVNGRIFRECKCRNWRLGETFE